MKDGAATLLGCGRIIGAEIFNSISNMKVKLSISLWRGRKNKTLMNIIKNKTIGNLDFPTCYE